MSRNYKTVPSWAVGIACACFFAAGAHALTITDPGVAGIVDYDRDDANVTTRTLFANHLLSLGANDNDTSDQNGNGIDEYYETSGTDYNGPLTGGIDAGFVLNVSIYDWVMAKYDGPNAGYVLFYVPDLLSGTIPEFSFDIWGDNANQYQLSGITAFGSRTPPGGGDTPGTGVPDGGMTVALMGMGLLTLSTFKRRLKAA